MAEQEILIVGATLVVHCCVAKKNVIVASQLYDVADVQFTVEYRVARLAISWPILKNLAIFGHEKTHLAIL